MNRRDMLKSGALFTGSLAIIGMPMKSYGILPIIPPLPKPFNRNIMNAHCTASSTAVASANAGTISSAELTTIAVTFATFVDEMNSTNLTTNLQDTLSNNLAAVLAYDLSTINLQALLTSAQKVGPFTYANFQQALASAQTATRSAFEWTTLFSNLEANFQALATLASQSGGYLPVSAAGRRGRPHFQEINKYVEYGMAMLTFACIVAAVVFPPVTIGVLATGVVFTTSDLLTITAATAGYIGATDALEGN